MASSVVLIILLLCYAIVGTQTIGRTTVEVTSLSHPVAVGGILAISCEIRNMQEEYTVSFFREFNGNTEQIATDQTYFPSLLRQRVYISKRASPDGNSIYFMTVVDITLDDKGKYVCTVNSLKNGKSVEIATNLLNIEIISFPHDGNPTCKSIPNRVRVNEGTQLRFICTSKKSNPLVRLQWSTNNDDIHTGTDNSNEETVFSEIMLTAKRSHNGATFVCTMTSSRFPERQRSCYVGPLSVVHENIVSRDNRLDDVPSKDYDLSLSNGCDISCSSEDTNTVLYLAAGTMGATILMLTFLITTIILCCKYCKISGEVRAVQRSVPFDDGSEPVYVSLQRRPEHDRSSMYMSVEDPNNPGNKILMPREVVEEFYRSLSLKRKK